MGIADIKMMGSGKMHVPIFKQISESASISYGLGTNIISEGAQRVIDNGILECVSKLCRSVNSTLSKESDLADMKKLVLEIRTLWSDVCEYESAYEDSMTVKESEITQLDGDLARAAIGKYKFELMLARTINKIKMRASEIAKNGDSDVSVNYESIPILSTDWGTNNSVNVRLSCRNYLQSIIPSVLDTSIMKFKARDYDEILVNFSPFDSADTFIKFMCSDSPAENFKKTQISSFSIVKGLESLLRISKSSKKGNLDCEDVQSSLKYDFTTSKGVANIMDMLNSIDAVLSDMFEKIYTDESVDDELLTNVVYSIVNITCVLSISAINIAYDVEQRFKINKALCEKLQYINDNY